MTVYVFLHIIFSSFPGNLAIVLASQGLSERLQQCAKIWLPLQWMQIAGLANVGSAVQKAPLSGAFAKSGSTGIVPSSMQLLEYFH